MREKAPADGSDDWLVISHTFGEDSECEQMTSTSDTISDDELIRLRGIASGFCADRFVMLGITDLAAGSVAGIQSG